MATTTVTATEGIKNPVPKDKNKKNVEGYNRISIQFISTLSSKRKESSVSIM
jgi:hypothetical protein